MKLLPALRAMMVPLTWVAVATDNNETAEC
jgi:hypothetical protein